MDTIEMYTSTPYKLYTDVIITYGKMKEYCIQLYSTMDLLSLSGNHQLLSFEIESSWVFVSFHKCVCENTLKNRIIIDRYKIITKYDKPMRLKLILFRLATKKLFYVNVTSKHSHKPCQPWQTSFQANSARIAVHNDCNFIDTWQENCHFGRGTLGQPLY